MSVIKIIGAAVVIIASYFIGDGTLDGYRRKIAFFEELQSFASLAAKQIDLYRLSLKDIICSHDTPVLRETKFYKYITSCESNRFEVEWLSEEDKRAVQQFSSSFTRSGGISEYNAAEKLAVYAGDRLDEIKKEYENMKKISRSLPPIAVMSVMLLLL